MTDKGYRMGKWLILLTTLLSVGCTTPTPITPPSLPTWSVEQHYELNPSAPLMIDVNDHNSIDINEVMTLQVSILPLHVIPTRLLDPGEAYVRTMTLCPHPQFVTPVLKYSKGVRMGSVVDAETYMREIQKAGYGRVQLFKQIDGALPQGTSWQVDVTDSSSRERLTLQLARPNSLDRQLECVLSHTVQDGSIPMTERLLFHNDLFEKSSCWAMVIPYCHPSAGTKAMALIARIEPTPQDFDNPTPYRTILSRCLKQLRQQQAQMPLSQFDQEQTDPWQQAVDLLRWPSRQRKTLHYMTQQSPFAHELVIAAPRPMIRSLADALIVAHEQDLLSQGQTAWHVEQLAYSVVLQSWETGQLNPAVQALLSVHTGQVGRNLSTLRNVLQQASGPQVFTDLLIQENRFYLHDISPAARVRAYRWLEQHQAAPAHFDPLGSAQERRDALAEHHETVLSTQESSLDQ